MEIAYTGSNVAFATQPFTKWLIARKAPRSPSISGSPTRRLYQWRAIEVTTADTVHPSELDSLELETVLYTFEDLQKENYSELLGAKPNFPSQKGEKTGFLGVSFGKSPGTNAETSLQTSTGEAKPGLGRLFSGKTSDVAQADVAVSDVQKQEPVVEEEEEQKEEEEPEEEEVVAVSEVKDNVLNEGAEHTNGNGVSEQGGTVGASAVVSQPEEIKSSSKPEAILPIKDEEESKEEVAESEPAAAPVGETPQFDWYKQWYAILVESNLDPSQPETYQLMGKQLVVWQSKEGQWNCFEDENAQRNEDENVGWRFDAEGKCTRVPQSMNDTPTVEELESSTAQTMPVVSYGGIIWVWPDNSEDRFEESAAHSPWMPDDLKELVAKPTISVARGSKLSVYHRLMAAGYDAVVENALDPAHFCVAHHGIGKPNRNDARDLNVEVVKDPEGPLFGTGPVAPTVAARAESPFISRTDTQNMTMEYFAPNYIRFRTDLGMDSYGSQHFLLSPVGPGITSLIYVSNTELSDEFVEKKVKGGIMLALMTMISKVMPLWYSHLETHDIIAGDVFLLHNQEKTLLESGKPWQKAYNLPTRSDAIIIALRKWMDSFAGGGAYPNDAGERMPREQVFNHYEQHTKYCRVCQEGMKQLKTVRMLCGLLAFGLVGALFSPAKPIAKVLSVSGGLVCALVWFFAGNLLQRFYFNDRVHAEIE